MSADTSYDAQDKSEKKLYAQPQLSEIGGMISKTQGGGMGFGDADMSLTVPADLS